MKIELFLDKKFIKEKTPNIKFEINKPIFEKNVLKLDRDYETINGYFTVLYVKNEYKMYYRVCPYNYYKDRENKTHYSTDELSNHEYLCLAVSSDGLNFEKKNYNIVNYNNSVDNNIIKHDLFCHNFYPYYDKINNKYIAISGTNIYNKGLHLFESIDGINWTYIKIILDETYLVPGWNHHNHFDSHNCIVYNKNDDYYYIYLRNNKPNQRFVQYTKTKDFNEFTKCENINIYENNNLIMYTPGIFEYNNYFLSIPTIQKDTYNYDTKNNSFLMISTNGIDFNILTKELFINNEEEILNKDRILNDYYSSDIIFKMNINSMVPSIDNTKIYIYTHNILEKKSFITCHSFEKNKINKIICNDIGFIKTELIKILNKLKINYETFNNGYISIQLISIDNKIIYNTDNFYESNYELDVQWNNFKIIEPNNYYIKFNMYNCILYSFSYE